MARVVDLGFTCLSPGGGNPQADVVFVHGLGGHPQRTWSTKQSPPNASAESGTQVPRRARFAKKLSSLGRLLRSKNNSESDQNVASMDDGLSSSTKQVFWPSDFLPKDFHDIRILTYGYHSDPLESFQNNILTLTNGLLTELANERTDTLNRPIIFIAHSLGGILVKKALNRSQHSTGAEAHLKSIRDATKGIVFFGTPHSGSDMVSWAEVLRRVLGTFISTNKTLLATLDSQHDNGQLEELRIDFAKMLGPTEEKKFRVVNFRENQPLVDGPGGPITKLVVSLASASIESEWASNQTLDGNHHTICKFSENNDRKYRLIKAEVERFLEDIKKESQQKEELSEDKIQWLPKLLTCPYRERKDTPNPTPVEGTCKWFTSHPLFCEWQQSSKASLLWVSADPGCGKSVLARHLVDNLLPSNKTRTTCYFFFKDGYPDQTSITGALCCILHQIFKEQPTAFSAQILQKFKEDGDKLLTSFSDLWDILISVFSLQKDREVVCVFDALDECNESGQGPFIQAISNFFTNVTTKTPVLKMLLTSRPYLDIKTRFHELEQQIPTIHLSGENEEEIDKISQEIDVVIQQRVADISKKRGLGKKEHGVLIEELTRIPNRTYLWVHLIINEVDCILLAPGKIRSKIRQIPKTVDEAYDNILSKSKDTDLAQRLLHIVVAAKRPLTVQEMALALAIRPEHKSLDDIDLIPEDRFRNEVRELCGLFITIVGSKIYLLHQTAREFLVPSQQFDHSHSLSTHNISLQWKSIIRPEESNYILAEICISRLSLSDFNLIDLQNIGKSETNWLETDAYISDRILLRFAAEYWTDYFRECDTKNRNLIINIAVAYCSRQSPISLAWFEVYKAVVQYNFSGPKNPTPLMIAAYFGLSDVVERLLPKALVTINEIEEGWTALCLAAKNGHKAVVQQLLTAGADVYAQDNDGFTALHYAAENGYKAVVQQLLTAGADVHAQDNDGFSALHWAARYGNEAIMQQLLTAGADVYAQNNNGLITLY